MTLDYCFESDSIKWFKLKNHTHYYFVFQPARVILNYAFIPFCRINLQVTTQLV